MMRVRLIETDTERERETKSEREIVGKKVVEEQV